MGCCHLGGLPPQRCKIWCSPGSTNARVLPLPVSAKPIRSRFASKMGQHCAWMGLGCVKVLHEAFTTFAGRRLSLKARVGSVQSSSSLT